MIRRPILHHTLTRALRASPIVALLGPRQCGKTTLARQVAREQGGDYFDLEDPVDVARIAQPQLALADLRGLVVIDEIQRQPRLLELLRVLADRPRTPARFLILGSAAPELTKGASETLAGRVRFIDMAGFDLREVPDNRLARLWLRGGFPRSFLAPSDAASLTWRDDFVRTFLERDIPQLGVTIPAATLRRFWTMLAHFHGNVWNAAELARALGSAEPTARRYLDLLVGSYVVRSLPPWHANLGKRQVRMPKVYVRDSGLLHALLAVGTRRELLSHPKVGASWEGFVIEQILALAGTREAYFWGTHGGAELDLLLIRGGKPVGFEVKLSDAPTLTKSMGIAYTELALSRLYVVYPGTKAYRLAPGIEAIPLGDVPAVLK